MKKEIFAFCFCQNLVPVFDTWLLGNNYNLLNLKWCYVTWLSFNGKISCLIIVVSFALVFSFKQKSRVSFNSLANIYYQLGASDVTVKSQ